LVLEVEELQQAVLQILMEPTAGIRTSPAQPSLTEVLVAVVLAPRIVIVALPVTVHREALEEAARLTMVGQPVVLRLSPPWAMVLAMTAATALALGTPVEEVAHAVVVQL
jgi:hypothetical protein